METGRIIPQKFKKAFIQSAAVSDKCAEVAGKITAKAVNTNDKIEIIRDYIDKNIRRAGPRFDNLPLSALTPADKTLSDGYGHSADIALVFHAMLSAVGYKPEFAIVLDIPKVPEIMDNVMGYPQTGFFADVLVKIIEKGKPLYLNCSSQYAKPGTCRKDGYMALLLCSGKFEEIKVAELLENKSDVCLDINIDSSGNAEITKTVKYYGTDYEYFNKKYSEMTPEKRDRYFQNETNRISQAASMVSKNVEVNKYPAVKKLKVKVTRYAVKDKKYIYFTLPSEILQGIIRVGADKRVMPYYRSGSRKMSFTYNITLPDKLKNIIMQPAGFDWSSPNNGGDISYSVEKVVDAANKLQLKCDINLKPSFVGKHKYRDLTFIADKLSKTSTWLILAEME